MYHRPRSCSRDGGWILDEDRPVDDVWVVGERRVTDTG